MFRFIVQRYGRKFTMKHRVIYLLVLCIILQLATSAAADQLVLSNGDRISGKILSIVDDSVLLLTEYAGELRVELGKVADLQTDGERAIELKNGDMIAGRIESISAEQIVISSFILGSISIQRADFGSLDRPVVAEEPAELKQTRERLEQTEADLKTAEENLKQKEKEIGKLSSVTDLWEGKFEVGTKLQRGNTDTSDLHVETLAIRKAPREELRLRAYSDYGETQGETDTNEIFGEAKLKVFQTERFYLFGLTNMEYDEMENLDLRAQLFAGLGYIFVKRERTNLLGEIGAGATGEFFDREDAGGDGETVEGTLWLNGEYRQKIFKDAEFFQGLTVYPSLSRIGDFRLRSETGLAAPLAEQWSIKLSLIDDYDSDPESRDVKRNDLKLISSILYKF
jgi:putative salt-induced outer membrane protein YdiY